MKKIILALALAISLTGCAGMSKSLLEGGSSILASADNPITSERLFQIEASFSTAASAALAYRRSCIRGALPRSCRDHVERIRPVAGLVRRTLLPQLRAFVRQNDQVNALRIFFEIKGLVDNLRSTVGAV